MNDLHSRIAAFAFAIVTSVALLGGVGQLFTHQQAALKLAAAQATQAAPVAQAAATGLAS